MIAIKMSDYIKGYGENKDVAKELRQKVILPALEKSECIVIDFKNITGVTQSFIHALLAEPIRKYPEIVFDKVSFKACNDMVKVIIETVEEYMQESLQRF